MNLKYKPGIYFGIYTMVLCLAIPLLFHIVPLSKYNIWSLLIAAPIGGVMGGFVFGWIWSLFKKYPN